jgi:hypothetical protein
MVTTTAKHRGKHHRKELTLEFLLGLQSPLDLLCEGLWQTQLGDGLFHSSQGVLCACLLSLEPLALPLEATLLGLVSTFLSGFRAWIGFGPPSIFRFGHERLNQAPFFDAEIGRIWLSRVHAHDYIQSHPAMENFLDTHSGALPAA